jgi:hypothetical protein
LLRPFTRSVTVAIASSSEPSPSVSKLSPWKKPKEVPPAVIDIPSSVANATSANELLEKLTGK